MLFGLSPLELGLIALALVLLFGVGRLTKAGKDLGSGLRGFISGFKEGNEEAKKEEEKKE